MVFIFFPFSGYLRVSFPSADAQVVRRLVPLYYMFVKVVDLIRQSESKCQNVCIGQRMNVGNYVVPYAVYCG